MSLWLLIILSLSAVSLGWNAQMELAFLKRSYERLKAKERLWKGMRRVKKYLKEEKQKLTRRPIVFMEQEDEIQGLLKAEEGRININALHKTNHEIFTQLLILLEVDSQTAQLISAAVVDWRDTDHAKTIPSLETEAEYYQGLDEPYLPKNGVFHAPEEVLLVRGMTLSIYERLKKYITVIPFNASQLTLHMESAPLIVLRAFTRGVSQKVNTHLLEADSLAEKLHEYRIGPDGRWQTDDDQRIDVQDIALNTSQHMIWATMQRYRVTHPQYYRARLTTRVSSGRTTMQTEAVLNNSFEIVYWRREQ